jgi:tRNA 2-selenouridine synthase
MRSAAVAWLLDLYGFEVHLLEGGYKHYRRWVLRKISQDYNFRVIGGNTGAGKTPVLQVLHKSGYRVLDLEQIAGHKGSAFGGLDGIMQPGQEQFENNLADRLYQLTANDPGVAIYVEDESQRIGAVNLPEALYQGIRRGEQYFLNVPFDARLDHITQEYGAYNTEALVNAVIRIKKRLGPLETKTAVSHLIEGDRRACFAILLHYYDKHYAKARASRPAGAGPLRIIDCESVETSKNTRSLIMHLMNMNAIS